MTSEPERAPTDAPPAKTYWRPAETVPSRRVLWGCALLVIAVIVGLALVYGFLFMQVGDMMAVPTERIAAEVSEASSGRIFDTVYIPGQPGGRARFFFYVPSDASEAEGARLACAVVRPVLSREGYESTPFLIQRHGGGVIDVGPVIASDSTSYP